MAERRAREEGRYNNVAYPIVDQESRFSCPEGLEQLPWATSRHDWDVATASSHHAAFFQLIFSDLH